MRLVGEASAARFMAKTQQPRICSGPMGSVCVVKADGAVLLQDSVMEAIDDPSDLIEKALAHLLASIEGDVAARCQRGDRLKKRCQLRGCARFCAGADVVLIVAAA